MSLTEDLKVYSAMYNLLLKLMDARSKFDKPYKYVVGDKLIERALECISLIHFANEDRRQGARVEHLNRFVIEFDILQTLIMVCRDRQQFKSSALLGDVFAYVADVEKQASAWRRDSIKALKKQNDEKNSAV